MTETYGYHDKARPLDDDDEFLFYHRQLETLNYVFPS